MKIMRMGILSALTVAIIVLGLTLWPAADVKGAPLACVANADFQTYRSGAWSGGTRPFQCWNGSGWENTTAVPTASNNVTILNGHTVTASTSGQSANSLTINSGGILTLSGQSIYVYGNWKNNGTFNNGGLGVIFSASSGTQTISGSGTGAFAQLAINSGVATGATVVLNVDVTAGDATNSLQLQTGDLDLNGHTLTLNTASGAGRGIRVMGTRTILGTGGGTLLISNTKAVCGVSGTTCGSTGWPSTGTLIIGSGATLALGAAIDLNYSTTGATTINGTLQFNSSGSISNGVPTYGSSSTLAYNTTRTVGTEWGAGTSVGSGVPRNVTIQSGTVTTPSSARTVPGNLTINSGSTFTLNATSGDLNVGGNWSNSGTFTHNSRTVTFNGSAAQSIGGTATTTFYDLTLNNTNGVNLGLAGDANQQVNHTLTLSGNTLLTLGPNDLTMGSSALAIAGGTFSPSKMIVADGSGALCRQYTAATSYDFPIGDTSGPSLTANYSPATLNFTSGTFASAYACVRVTDSVYSPIPANRASYLTRYWTATSSGITSFNCNVTFTYVDNTAPDTDVTLVSPALETSIKYQHSENSGTSWTQGAGTDAVNNKLTGSVSGFSVHTGFSQSPTAVTLESMEAVADSAGGRIDVTWQTAQETDNAGFNLWRGTTPAGPDVQLNAALILSQAPGSGLGASYAYADSQGLAAGTTYYYWLEDVSLAGAVTRHEPVSATYAAPTAVGLSGFDAASALPAALPFAGAGLALAALAWARRRRAIA